MHERRGEDVDRARWSADVVAVEADEGPRHWRWGGVAVAAAVVALGLVTLANGGGVGATTSVTSDKAASAATTTAVTAGAKAKATTTTARASTTTAAPASTSSTALTTTVVSPEFCPLALAYVQDLRYMAISLTDLRQLQTLVGRAAPAVARSAAAAPAEIKADVALLATTIGQYATGLEKAGYDLAKVPPEVVMKLQAPPVQNAISRIDSYLRKTCG